MFILQLSVRRFTTSSLVTVCCLEKKHGGSKGIQLFLIQVFPCTNDLRRVSVIAEKREPTCPDTSGIKASDGI